MDDYSERTSDGVGQLDENTAGNASLDEGLGDPSCGVGSRAIDLGEVLSAESTSTVGTPSTVGVDDDLATGETGITLRPTDNETP